MGRLYLAAVGRADVSSHIPLRKSKVFWNGAPVHGDRRGGFPLRREEVTDFQAGMHANMALFPEGSRLEFIYASLHH